MWLSSYTRLDVEHSTSPPPVPMTEDQNTTTTSTPMMIDSMVVESDEGHPIVEVGQHHNDRNPFTLDAPKTQSGHVCHAQDFAMLSVCTCGEPVTDEEVSACQGIIQCKKAGLRDKMGEYFPVAIFDVSSPLRWTRLFNQ